MNNWEINFSEMQRFLEVLEGTSSLKEGLECSLPILCELFAAVIGKSVLKVATVREKDGWSTLVEWSATNTNLPVTSSSVLLEFIEHGESQIQVGAVQTPFVHQKKIDLQQTPITVLFVPVVDSGTVAGYYILEIVQQVDNGEDLVVAASFLLLQMKLWLRSCRAEKQLQDLIDFIPNPFMMLDASERVIVWNPAMEKMSGVDAKEILGKGNYEHARPFYKERRPTVSNLILNPDSTWEPSYQELRKEGDAVYALARSEELPGGPMLIASKTCVTRDLTDNINGSAHMIQDVTNEHELETSLNRTEKMYQSISEFSGVGIVLLGELSVYSCNDNFLALMELNDKEVTVEAILERIDSQNDRCQIEGFLSNEMKEVRPTSFEFTSILPKKGRREFKGYAQSVTYQNKAAIHFVIIDVTEANAMERRKKIHLMKMYHSDRLSALGTLSAGIAHELNQPLNTIRVITDGVLYGKEQGWAIDEDESYDNAAMISKQILRMSQVIKNIKNFARDEFERSSEDVELNEAIQNVFSMIGQQMIAHNIDVDIKLEAGLPKIRSQLNHLEQVIMNLVVNARQALDCCVRKNKRIWIKTGNRFGQIFLEVGDNATGVPEVHQKEIFDPFFTTKVVGHGTGLGLSISQSIIAGYDGDIQSYNNSDGGATFFITIPIRGMM